MIDHEKLGHLVGEGWLRCVRHPDADYFLYNYTPKTQYEKHWTTETMMCRGLILDADGSVVARPFGKFFNYGDPLIGQIPADEHYTVTEKIDGSLGILYWLDGEPCIATRGSFTSEQAVAATAMIRDADVERTPYSTPLFEIVYPGNRIVVDYGDRRDLTLLASVSRATGHDAPLPAYSGPRVLTFEGLTLDDLAGREAANAEGFVVSFESGLRVKVKFAEYVRLHKILSGVSARMVWEELQTGRNVSLSLDGVPDEVYDWVCRVEERLWSEFDGIMRHCSDVFTDRPAGDRREIAEYFKASGANTAVLFKMLDDKPYADLVWKAIYPGVERPSSLEDS